MKKGIIAICAVLTILVIATALVLTANKGNVSKVNRVVGYSALYDNNLINEACRVVEQKFADEFEGCALTELRYDEEVENRFADEIVRYATDEDKEYVEAFLHLSNRMRYDDNGMVCHNGVEKGMLLVVMKQ